MFRPIRPKPLMPTLMDMETPPKQDERRTSLMLGGARTQADRLPGFGGRFCPFSLVSRAFGELHQPAQAVVDRRLGERHTLSQLVQVHLRVGPACPRHVLQSRRESLEPAGPLPLTEGGGLAYRRADGFVDVGRLEVQAAVDLARKLTDDAHVLELHHP